MAEFQDRTATAVACHLERVKPVWHRGYHDGSPTAVRPSDPALCGSCPL